MEVEEINPYNKTEGKSQQVEEMFNSIAPAYDFMNNAMTLGLHRYWRNRALKAAIKALDISLPKPDNAPGLLNLLDIATGTGDVAFKLHAMLPFAKITGIDISEGMLQIARNKLLNLPEIERQLIAFGKGDSLALPFHDGDFSMITVAYGVRNFSNLSLGLAEMKRVLKPGGVLCIIELSTPNGKLTAPAYKIYSRKFIPFIGKMVSGDQRAYSYLPESIAACPQREDMAALLRAVGFESVQWKELTFGAVTYYLAR